MDFFETQDVARKHTGRLVVLFVLAVLGIIVSTYLLVAGVVIASGHEQSAGHLTDPGLLLLIGGATILVVGGGSLYKLNQLRGGGRVIAEELGGRLLVSAGADWKARRLLNVVDEMAIASGIPAPAVYLLDAERGINAFAAGFTPADAVIGVTQGCLDRLNREQLQGVIGHEFSHILNGDMRLSLRLIGVLHGILLIGLLGYGVLRMLGHSGGMRVGGSRRSGKSNDKGGGIAAVFAIAIGLIVIGFVGVFFGNLIKAAVSRQREYLADASGVQFTRNPDGLAGALKTIGAVPGGSKLVAAKAAEASHMYFAKGLSSGLQSMFATHPPLAARIQRLDPSWDGAFPELPEEPSDADVADDVDTPVARSGRGVGSGRAGVAGDAGDAGFAALAGADLAAQSRARGAATPAATASPEVWRLDSGAAGHRAVERAGRPTPAHVELAAALIDSLPEVLRTAAREPWGARAVVLALLVHRDGAPRSAQLRRLAALADPGLAEFTEQILPQVERLPPSTRLPLVDLAIPALRALSPAQHDEFIATLDDLFAADGSIDLFEWSLSRILRRHLASSRHRVAPPRLSGRTLADLRTEISVLLSALARAGAADEFTPGPAAGSDRSAKAGATSAQSSEAAAGQALKRAAAALSMPEIKLLPEAECGTAALDAALDALSALHPLRKRELLTACAECVAADGEVRISEAELVRAFADGFGVPMPPLLGGSPQN